MKCGVPLGVGGSTTFHMKSNHQTAFNHSFRDTSAYDPALQMRVKCSSCGCWAQKGRPCYQCKRPAQGIVTPRNNSAQVEPYLRRPTTTDHSTNYVIREMRSETTRKKNSENAHHHKYRDESSFNPAAQVKLKCSFCGCWANRDAPCSLCKTINKK